MSLRLLLLLGLLPCSATLAHAQSSAPMARYEARLDSILHADERPGRLAEALDAYRGVETEHLTLGLAPTDPGYPEQQRTLAYALLRQGNMLRQLGRAEEALRLAERELEAARASGDPLTRARTEFSFGLNLLASGESGRGLRHLERARANAPQKPAGR
jgi:tetratricopeptide (TPR) repeat protein